jgi:uncharacterized protein (TIGR02231 family)
MMKKYKTILFTIITLFSIHAIAQNGGVYDDFIYTNKKPVERKVSSVVSNVTVFSSQAQVTRTAKVNLEAGVFNIVFEKLSPYINMNSLEIKADAGLTILSVCNRNDFLNRNEKPADIVLLEDSLVNINAAIADFKADKESIVHQKDLMLANRNVGSNQTGVKSDELEDLMELYQKKLDVFKINWFRLGNLETKYYGYKNTVELQLAAYNNGKLTLNNEVILTVKAENNVQNANINLTYLVGNVSWQPFYDIRIKDNKSNVQVFLKANITQTTGEDWNNVNLKLTTANPAVGGIKPELQTNWLGFVQIVKQEVASNKIKMLGGMSDDMGYHIDGVRVMEDKKVNNKPTVSQNLFNIEFETNIAYTIPSDNQNHQVDLTSFSQGAIYGYAVVPKLNKEVFVTAQVLANDLINQISGEANVYYDGTFTGKTFISPTTNDTLLLTLGRNTRIQVERIKLKEFCSKSFFGSTKKDQITYEIKVKNTQKDPIILTIEDQIPVSNNSEIEVKVLEYEGATYDVNKGKLTWKMELKADESKLVKFSFEVKSPKDKPLTAY